MKRRSEAMVLLLLAGTSVFLAFRQVRRSPCINIHAPTVSRPKGIVFTRSYRFSSAQFPLQSSPFPDEGGILFVAQSPSKGIIQSVISLLRSAVSHVVSFVKKLSFLWRRTEPEVSQVDDFPAALFVNRKSGGKDGKALLKSLYKHINKRFICDVLHEGPHKRLSQALRRHWEKRGLPSSNHTAASVPLLPVICCGGDGTIRWIMDEAHAHGHSQFCSFGVMPMGTGNDLFNHVLSYVDRQQANRLAVQLSPGNQIHQTLRALSTFDMPQCDSEARTNSSSVRASAAYTVDFDRWQISVSAHPLSRSARLREKLRSSLAQSSASLVRRLRVTSRRATQRNESDGVVVPQSPSAPSGAVRSRIAFNNYFGIGIDGDITCAFDNLRKQRPQWFFHRLINKAWYGVVWTYKFCRGNAKNLSRDIDIYVDGQKLNTSALDLRGVILPNIVSYAGGTRLWTFAGEEVPPHGVLSDPRGVDADGAALRRWQSQSSEDGLLEVVGLTGWTHLASVKGGFMRPVPLAQGRHIRIVSKVRLPMQVDGEPLIQAPCVLDVRPLETVKLLIPQPLE